MYRQGLEFDDLLWCSSAGWPCISTFALSGVSEESRNRHSRVGQLRLVQPRVLNLRPPGMDNDLMKSMPLLKLIERRVYEPL